MAEEITCTTCGCSCHCDNEGETCGQEEGCNPGHPGPCTTCTHPNNG